MNRLTMRLTISMALMVLVVGCVVLMRSHPNYEPDFSFADRVDRTYVVDAGKMYRTDEYVMRIKATEDFYEELSKVGWALFEDRNIGKFLMNPERTATFTVKNSGVRTTPFGSDYFMFDDLNDQSMVVEQDWPPLFDGTRAHIYYSRRVTGWERLLGWIYLRKHPP